MSNRPFTLPIYHPNHSPLKFFTHKMINNPHFLISGDSSSSLHLSLPTTTSATQQLVPYSPPKKKRRIKLIRVETLFGTSSSGGATRAPVRPRKPDPSALKITRPCTECGKKFWSWKALFGHMRCHPERQWRGINPPENLRPPKSAAAMTEEEHEMAACLLMLANGPGPQQPEIENEGIMICANPSFTSTNYNHETVTNYGDNCGFECSSCKKVFGSHQALGGHRASHKNVKGCFAINHSGNEDVVEGVGDVAEMVAGLGHKCDICFRVFSSGQALGWHKRGHFGKRGLYCLDLNLPDPIEDYEFNDSFSCFSSELALDLRLGI